MNYILYLPPHPHKTTEAGASLLLSASLSDIHHSYTIQFPFSGTTRLQTSSQQDCVPVRKASSVCEGRKKVEELACPAQTPDLNPIDHLWDELKLAASSHNIIT